MPQGPPGLPAWLKSVIVYACCALVCGGAAAIGTPAVLPVAATLLFVLALRGSKFLAAHWLEHGSDRALLRWWALGSLALGVAAVVGAFAVRPSGQELSGVLLQFLRGALLPVGAAGIGSFAMVGRVWARGDGRPGPVLGLVGAVLIGGPILLARASPHLPALLLAAVLGLGLAVAALGCALMSERALLARGSRPYRIPLEDRRVQLGALGIVVLLMAMWLGWSRSGLGAVVTLLVAAIALNLAIAARNSADAMIVAVVALLLFTVVPRGVDEPSPRAEASSGIIAIGDSYMSGEGAMSFYADTNTSGNGCRRAPSAYAPLLSRSLNRPLTFLACSGATVADMMRTTNAPADGPQPAQVQLLRELRAGATDGSLILLDGGGNDIGFAEVARTCMAPGDCSQIGGGWLSAADGLRSTLAAFYGQVLEAAPTAQAVVVLPYPSPVAPPLCQDGESDTGERPSCVRAEHTETPTAAAGTAQRCEQALFTNTERVYLWTLVSHLNQAVAGAVADARRDHPGAAARISVMDTVPAAFADAKLRLCDGPVQSMGVNMLARASIEGGLTEQINPLNWFHNSVHPNEKGHARIALVAQEWLATHLSSAAAPATPSSTPPAAVTPPAPVSYPSVTGAPSSWVLGQLADVALLGIWLFLLAVWVLVIAVIRLLAQLGLTTPLYDDP